MPTLETIGHALYGSMWQSAMARSLKVSDRTVRRWHAGEYNIPEGVWSELAALLVEHGDECLRLANKL